MLDEIKAECVYADPTAPYPKWYTDDSRENLKNEQKQGAKINETTTRHRCGS